MTISKWQVISFAAIHPVQILMGCVWLLTACKPNLLHIASCSAPYVYVINVANFLFSASKSITALLLLLLLHGGREDLPTKEIATLWRVNYCPAGASGNRANGAASGTYLGLTIWPQIYRETSRVLITSPLGFAAR